LIIVSQECSQCIGSRESFHALEKPNIALASSGFLVAIVRRSGHESIAKACQPIDTVTLSQWIMGSVTGRDLKATKFPMLIVRPQQMKTSAPRHLDCLAPKAIS
jgi:hypothetical protein